MEDNTGKKRILYRQTKTSKVLDDIITEGFNQNASDIHIEPKTDEIRILYRIDGLLHVVQRLHLGELTKMISRLKIIANLDTTETRKPQDGHILFQSNKVESGYIDLRLSIFPSTRGEVAVMRILNRKDLLFDNLESLNIDPDDAERIREVASSSSGMILVTGPGGSGKTTTLYTILNFIVNSPSKKNIVTLEDPVELSLKGIRQAQIQPDIGFNFADGIRSILRQDANVVMVGEIRDDETAKISLRAALMGVLFFSTMHTTNSIGAIARFVELGIPRSFISSAMKLVISKRLMRRICPNCIEADNPSQKLISMFNLTPEHVALLKKGGGCDKCFNTGYKGRIGVYEMLYVDEEIQQLILESATYKEIENSAKNKGMKTLKESALIKALDGITTIEEVIRVAS